MTESAAKELVRRFGQVFVTPDWAELDRVLAPGFVAHNGERDVVGADGWRRFVEESIEMFGETSTEAVELIEDGPLVAERWTFAGTDGLDGHGITVHRIVDGLIQENWAVFSPAP